MNKLYKGYDSITASDAFKQRMVRTLQNEASEIKEAAPHKTIRLPIKRRTFAILVAAVIMVLAIGTAAAVGISTMARLRDKTKARVEERQQMTEDERYLEARAEAEKWYSVDDEGHHPIYVVRLTESATMQDVTLTLKDIAEVSTNDRDERILELHFMPESELTGMVTTFDPEEIDFFNEASIFAEYDTFCEISEDARDFSLSFNGKTYSAYGIAVQYDNEDCYHLDFVIPDYVMPDEVPFGIEMTLSGTLERRDQDGAYIGEIGTFSIPFVYDYTDEMREADIEEYAQQLMHDQKIFDQLDADAVSAPLPEEATELNQTVGIITYHDVTADEQGIYLGLTIDYGPINDDKNEIMYYDDYYSIDGYTVLSESVLGEWVYDPEQSFTGVFRLPYYTARENIGDEVTVACVCTLLMHDEWQEPCPLVFRYNLKTGKVTLPKDDAERDAWFIPPMERNGNRSYEVISIKDVSETQSGVSVTIDEVAFDSWGLLHIYYHADNLACAYLTEYAETCPVEYRINDAIAVQYWREDDSGSMHWVSEFDIEDYIAGGEIQKTHTAKGEWIVILPQSYESYDGPITIEIRDWKLYDLNEKGERVLVGTYNFTFTVEPKDAHTQEHAPRESYFSDLYY